MDSSIRLGGTSLGISLKRKLSQAYRTSSTMKRTMTRQLDRMYSGLSSRLRRKQENLMSRMTQWRVGTFQMMKLDKDKTVRIQGR